MFDDFAACARYIVEQRYSSPAHMVAIGGSNGGLLVGAVLTQHPSYFRAVVSMVGIYDMLRSELHPNGAFVVTEYGTVKNPEQFKALYAYSPYHHVDRGVAYPAILMMTGDNDGRVNPAHSRKMIAELRASTGSNKPILLRTAANSGHGIGRRSMNASRNWRTCTRSSTISSGSYIAPSPARPLRNGGRHQVVEFGQSRRNRMNRRSFITTAAAAPMAIGAKLFAAPPRSKMGIATTSYSTYTKFRDPIAFMDHCASLGAAGVQMAIPNDATAARNIRAHAEQLGLYVEAMVPFPKSNDTSAFENALKIAKEAGAVATRTGTSGGRRYEKWNSLNDWKAFVEESTAAVKKIAPIADRMKMPVGMENHKDWTIEQVVALMKSDSSEYFGALVDFGNNIALLDAPDAVMEIVPYAKMCHMKDMAVQSYEDGFELSEVPLGEGILDLRKIVDGIRRANPNAHFSLEMMTRDPLKVPCLTDKYWITFPDRNGIYLARTLRMVDYYAARLQPLPTYDHLPPDAQKRMEDDNVKQCLNYGREKLDL